MSRGILNTYLTERDQRSLAKEPGPGDEGGHINIVEPGKRAWRSPRCSSTYGLQQNPPHSSPGSRDAPVRVGLHMDRQRTVSCPVGVADDIHNPVGETLSRKRTTQPGTAIAQEKLV
ncbi:hypothetical protein ATANTOWER_001717 [Ataeniobius toweri]|uniref:Uncharacterized protein n=1 Tax=Ataeniobius toweri TaxID=208326 RepID=A0ABU7A416_9TELE|nr:hypothetical protein [Ataeniobius toweri]